MAIIIEEIQQYINAEDTVKVVASIDKNGIPHVVFKGSVHVNADGNLEFYEILESSRNNQNLVHSIWFDKKVAVGILTPDKKSYEIVGKPIKSITAGKTFEQVYVSLREKLGDIDLVAIWIIAPESVREETFKVRLQQQEDNYPILKHLDRLYKDQ